MLCIHPLVLLSLMQAIQLALLKSSCNACTQGAAAEEAEEEAAPEGAGREEADARSVFVNNVDWGATPEELQQLFATCGTVNRVTILTDKFGNPKVSLGLGCAVACMYCTCIVGRRMLGACSLLLKDTMDSCCTAACIKQQPSSCSRGFISLCAQHAPCAVAEHTSAFCLCASLTATQRRRGSVLLRGFVGSTAVQGYAYVEFVETDAVDNAIMLDNSELRGRQIKVSRQAADGNEHHQHRAVSAVSCAWCDRGSACYICK